MTTSTDIQVLMVLLEEVRAIRQDNADFKAEIKRDNADFKSGLQRDMQDFKAEIKQDMQDFKAEIKQDINALNAEVKALHNDNIGLKHDVAGLYHWDYWLLSIILVVFAMPQIVAGIKSLFGAIIDGIAGIIALFRK